MTDITRQIREVEGEIRELQGKIRVAKQDGRQDLEMELERQVTALRQERVELRKQETELRTKENILLNQSRVEQLNQSPVEPPRQQGVCMAYRESFVDVARIRELRHLWGFEVLLDYTSWYVRLISVTACAVRYIVLAQTIEPLQNGPTYLRPLFQSQ